MDKVEEYLPCQININKFDHICQFIVMNIGKWRVINIINELLTGQHYCT